MTDRYTVIKNLMQSEKLLRRILSGDEKAWIEAEQHLQAVDQRQQKYQRDKEEQKAKRERRAKSGRKASGAFEIAPRIEDGVDHSAEGIVLVRKGGARLVWRQAGKYYANQMEGYKSAPAELEVMLPFDHQHRLPKHVTDHFRDKPKSRRLSLQLIADHRARIDELMGEGTANAVLAACLQRTVVLP